MVFKGALPRARVAGDTHPAQSVEFRLSRKGPHPKAVEAWVAKESLDEQAEAGQRFKGRVRWFAGGRGYINCRAFKTDLYALASSFEGTEPVDHSGSEHGPARGQLCEFSVTETGKHAEAISIVVLG